MKFPDAPPIIPRVVCRTYPGTFWDQSADVLCYVLRSIRMASRKAWRRTGSGAIKVSIVAVESLQSFGAWIFQLHDKK